MLDAILDGLLDTLKLIPFLFVAFFVLEFIEHKMDDKTEKVLGKSKKIGPLLGGLLGAIPQCGFSAFATNLFSKRVITIGTLIAIYLSTSDEMLPLMISNGTNYLLILEIIGTKVLLGIIFGFIIDLILRKQEKNDYHEIHEMCHDENCHCDENIFKSSFIHTIKITLYILFFNLLINIIIYLIGEESLSKFLMQGHFLSYIVASLFGLIPNCASSVIITELYLNNLISVGSMFSGLLTGSGVGILILFKENKNLKENILILLLIYFIGVISGFIIDMLGLFL